MSTLQVKRSGPVLRITLDNAAKRNALGRAEWDELAHRLDELEAGSADILVLSGEGPVFCAGVDRAMLEDAAGHPDGLVRQIEIVGALVARLERSPALTIAALNGPAIGIGVHLALATDFLLADRSGCFHLPEARLGIPDVQHLVLLESRLGRHRAMLACLGEKLSCDELGRTGVIGELYASGAELAAGVDELVARLVAIAPEVRRRFKRAAAGLRDGRGVPAQVAAVR